MSRWSSPLPISAYRKFPRTPGVYAIYEDGALVYIGQSLDMRRRFSSHLKKRPEIVIPGKYTVKFKLTQRLGDFLAWEFRLLHRLRPCWNIVGGTRERVPPKPVTEEARANMRRGSQSARKRFNTSSVFKGVSHEARNTNHPWVANIYGHNKLIHIGSFVTEEQAARAYDEKALVYFGSHAGLNFPAQENRV